MRINLLVALVVVLAAFAASAQSWGALFTPGARMLVVEAYACDGAKCSATIQMSAQPRTADAARLVGDAKPEWAERIRFKQADLLAFMRGACVVDDSARPTGFAQDLPVCPDVVAARKAADEANAKAKAEREKAPK